MQKLIDLINFSREKVRIYKDYDQIDRFEQFKTLPILRKEDIRFAPIIDRVSSPRINGHVFRSGATSGAPSVTISEKREYRNEMKLFAKYVRKMGIRRDDIVANFFPSGSLYSTFITSFDVFQQLPCLHLPFTSAAGNLIRYDELISTFPPTVLLGLPLELLKRSKEIQWEKRRVRLIFYSGERLSAAVSEKLRNAFPKASIMPFAYGTTECGNIAFPSNGALKVLTERIYAEIIEGSDDNVGRLIVTCLDRRKMPIIRYDTEDTVRVLKESKKGIAVFELVGRCSETVKLTGHFVDLGAMAKDLERLAPKCPSQFIISSLGGIDCLELRLHGRPGEFGDAFPTEILTQELSEAINAGNLQVNISYEPFITESRTGKTPLALDQRWRLSE